MGYTHYWTFNNQNLDADKFASVVKDFKKMVPVMEHLGVKLCDGHGEGSPIINEKEIIFNGDANCGHENRDLGIAWATKYAKGVSSEENSANNREMWFAGRMLETRTCDGDCSHETFYAEIKMGKKDLFNFCKTAYKPYDLAVTVVLVIFQHWFGNDIRVATDGEIENWKDAIDLCQHHLGYGESFVLCDDSTDGV